MGDVRDWSALLIELLEEIAIRVPSIEDFMAFRGVCTSWRAAARKDKFVKSWRVPLLMLAEKEGSDDREFYSLSSGKVCMRLSLPEAKGKKLTEARFGWFLTLTPAGEANLFNPFSGRQIELPSETTFPEYEIYESYNLIRRAVLSHNPSCTSEFVLMGIFGFWFLGFWRPNDKAWTRIESHYGAFFDVNYYNGKFYAINSSGNIWIWDVSQPDLKVANIILSIGPSFVQGRWAYLVESSTGELLVISRDGRHNTEFGANDYGVTKFIMVQVDVTRGRWKEITSLGDDAIFVGHNATLCVAASTFPDMVKPNRIYFSDDCWEAYSEIGGGKDTGVYNVEEGKIERFDIHSRSLICPPLWVTPSF